MICVILTIPVGRDILGRDGSQLLKHLTDSYLVYYNEYNEERRVSLKAYLHSE